MACNRAFQPNASKKSRMCVSCWQAVPNRWTQYVVYLGCKKNVINISMNLNKILLKHYKYLILLRKFSSNSTSKGLDSPSGEA